jgi:hypothetical protein
MLHLPFHFSTPAEVDSVFTLLALLFHFLQEMALSLSPSPRPEPRPRPLSHLGQPHGHYVRLLIWRIQTWLCRSLLDRWV